MGREWKQLLSDEEKKKQRKVSDDKVNVVQRKLKNKHFISTDDAEEKLRHLIGHGWRVPDLVTRMNDCYIEVSGSSTYGLFRGERLSRKVRMEKDKYDMFHPSFRNKPTFYCYVFADNQVRCIDFSELECDEVIERVGKETSRNCIVPVEKLKKLDIIENKCMQI